MKRHFLFNSKLYYCFLHIIFFFYIYSVQFVGMPFNIGTRVVLSIFGFLLIITRILHKTINFSFDKRFLFVFLALFGISIISIVSLMYNGTRDFVFFFEYPFSIILIMLSSYFLTKLISYKSSAETVPIIISLIINVVFIQVLISFIMFLYHPIGDWLNTIQVTSDKELRVLEDALEFRLVGFGSRFFGSGIVNGFALILIGSVLKFEQADKIKVFKYSIYFLFIFAFGMMMARTTIVGALLAISILFWPKTIFNIKRVKIISKFSLSIVVIPLFILGVLFLFFPILKESFELLFNFGFEMFVNYFESGNFESESTTQMGNMFVWPKHFMTYLIGDGLYTDTFTGAYYKAIDIGVIRLIYYFGLPGLIMYFTFQFQIAYFAFLKNRKYRIMFIVLSLYCVILNFKGFTDLFFLNILFFMNYSEMKIKNNGLISVSADTI
jgi:hypothetical protein